MGAAKKAMKFRILRDPQPGVRAAGKVDGLTELQHKRLAKWVWFSCEFYDLTRRDRPGRVTAADYRRRAKKIGEAADKLIVAIDGLTGGSNESAGYALKVFLLGEPRIYDDALSLRSAARKMSSENPKSTKSPDAAKNTFLEHIIEAYESVTGARAGFSFDPYKNIFYGPFCEFLLGAAEEAGIKDGPKAWRERFRRLNAQTTGE